MRLINSIFDCFLILIFLVWPSFLLADTDKLAPTAKFLTVSDIHFNPFYTCNNKSRSCLIIEKLRSAPASEWEKIFEQFDKEPSVYGQDTNYVLFKSSLAELKKQARTNQVRFVLVLGDFLSHDYKKNYQYYTGDNVKQDTQAFVDKTMQFITSALKNSFPNMNVFMVVGNNDGYGEHYTSSPIFYKNIAPIWSELIQDKKTATIMKQSFEKGGYYALTLPNQKKLRLIVLNTTFFSSRTNHMDHEAQEELQWLEKELSLLNNTDQKALIALHIPMGVDVTGQSEKQMQVIGLWKAPYRRQFLELLKQDSDHIIAILPGHIHVDWFQILPKDILVTATPAISPVIGNNPGFKIYQYYTNTLSIQDYATFYYPLNSNIRQWQLEYDFNQIYQPNCNKACELIEGIKRMQKTDLANFYKKYFAVGREIQAATKQTPWLSYYWRAIQTPTTCSTNL